MTFRKTIIALALLAAGCATTPEERAATAREFSDRVRQETADYFAANPGPLSLSNAVAIARERTLKLTQQELDAQLARIDRATAFSVFLPNVELAYGRGVVAGSAKNVPLLGGMRSNNLDFELASMAVTQPVFTPVAWMMFAETGYGVSIRDHVRDRARQLLDVQVAACFCRAAVAERNVTAYERRLGSSEALTNRVLRLVAEGFALEGDGERAEAKLAADRLGLLEARNARAKVRGELADLLKFWPLADFPVDGESIRSVAGDRDRELPPVEICVWEALTNRLDLYAGDETVALRKAQVLEALANFLPNVVLGGGGAYLSPEQLIAKGWAAGLCGTWAAFEGFRSVQKYREARARREAEFRLNEDRMLAVVVSVADCWRNLREARVRADAAAKAARAAAIDCRDAEKRFEDGRETLSVVLDKIAIRDEAQVTATSADYAKALAELMFNLAKGRSIL